MFLENRIYKIILLSLELMTLSLIKRIVHIIAHMYRACRVFFSKFVVTFNVHACNYLLLHKTNPKPYCFHYF